MTYRRQHPCLCLLGVGVLVAIALAGCGGEAPAPRPPPPPRPVFVPQEVKVELGEHGGELTLMTTEAGGYTRNGQPFQSGTTVEAEGNEYRVTLSDGTWSAEYLPPEPAAVALGTSGDALLIARQEDGSYQAGDATFESGDVLTASNDSMYRLTLEDGEWTVEFVAPDPVSVQLGASGESLSLTLREDGNYETGDGELFESGGIWKTASGSEYKLTLMDGEWSVEFVAPAPASVTLGTSGQTVQITRREDGRFEANGQLVTSGETFEAPERQHVSADVCQQ